MLRMLIALLSIALCDAAWCQTRPARPVRIVVGFGSGSPDTFARLIGQQLAVQTGQSYIVDNRPGAGGTIGADIVAKALPDGNTLFVSTATITVYPSLYKKLPFDVIKDFAPISQMAATEGYILVVTPALPVRDVKELIALARRPDSKISYGSNGMGSTGHLVAALFNSLAKTNMLHVPYKSAGAATNALMSNEVQVLFGTPTLSLPLIKSGRMRALAYDNDTRASFLPDVPTLAEAGAPATGMISWQGIFAPAKTPPAVLSQLENEVRKAIAVPQIRERIESLGLTPVGSSSADFRVVVARGVKVSAEAARAAGIEPE